jgi:hypothetical protein
MRPTNGLIAFRESEKPHKHISTQISFHILWSNLISSAFYNHYFISVFIRRRSSVNYSAGRSKPGVCLYTSESRLKCGQY